MLFFFVKYFCLFNDNARILVPFLGVFFFKFCQFIFFTKNFVTYVALKFVNFYFVKIAFEWHFVLCIGGITSFFSNIFFFFFDNMSLCIFAWLLLLGCLFIFSIYLFFSACNIQFYYFSTFDMPIFVVLRKI